MTALLVTAGAGFLQAKSYVVPHLLDTSGDIRSDDHCFDATLHVTYTPTVTGTSNQSVDVKYYVFSGLTADLAKGTDGTVICGPCSATLTGNARKVSIRLETEALKHGVSTNVIGYGLVTISGDDGNVGMTVFITNAQNNAFELSVFGITPQEIAAAVP
jgi:hypothetical protein